MSRPHLVLMSLMAMALHAQAREPTAARTALPSRTDLPRTPAEPLDRLRLASETLAPQQDALWRQRRRDGLRETLRAQPDDSSARARQMSLQEKSELRQQLRQQP